MKQTAKPVRARWGNDAHSHYGINLTFNVVRKNPVPAEVDDGYVGELEKDLRKVFNAWKRKMEKSGGEVKINGIDWE